MSGQNVAFRPLTFPDDVGRYETRSFGTMIVPKNRVKNLEFRKRLIEEAESNPEKQAAIKAVCRESCLFWINTFCWTYLQLHVNDGGKMAAVIGGRGAHIPFITWPVQDEVVIDLERCIRDGRDVAVDKSRDMGLSWLILTVFHWFWQFHKDVNFLEVSRKLDLVDSGEPDSLFWKHDYLLKHQPPWLVPNPRAIKRTTTPLPKLLNYEMGSSIVGQSTTGDVGHAGRRTAVLFDEAARIRELKTAWEGAASMTTCRIANSTPRGPVFFSKLVRSPAVHTIRVPWWDHPEKGKGRHQYFDKAKGKVVVTSPWRDMQIERAVTSREIAENIDLDHAGAGFVFFDADVLTRQMMAYARQAPTASGVLSFKGTRNYSHRDVAIREKSVDYFDFTVAQNGPWRLWIELEEDGMGRLRPPQNRSYVIGADVAGGTGASNSVLSVFDRTTGWKVAEFASNQTPPDELARIMCMAGYWFGGTKSMAFLCWEANGYGSVCGKHIVQLGYPWVYRTLAEQGKRATRKHTKWPGWWSNEQTKVDMLGDYRSALARDEYKNPSQEALDEAADYIWYEGGGVGPGELSQEKGDAKKTHGDRVIADALSWHASKYAPRSNVRKRDVPVGSIAERMRRSEEEKRMQRKKKKFFTSW